MQRSTKIVLLSALTLGATAARAEDVEGMVRVVGPAAGASVILTPTTEYNGPELCRGDLWKQVRRLNNLVVRVSGGWKLDDKGEKKCFQGESLTVLKVSSGRDAYVGTLSQKNGVYVLTADDGKALTLAEVSSGLKKLDGKKVILDLKTMDSPAAKEATYKVVSYSEFPTAKD